MDADLEPGILAMVDAVLAATDWSFRLYPENGWCVEDARIDALVLEALADGEEKDRIESVPGQTLLLVHSNGRVLAVAPDATRATLEASAKAAAPRVAACDYCAGPPAAVVGLLPVPAGATLTVFSLCADCLVFLRNTFPDAAFIALED